MPILKQIATRTNFKINIRFITYIACNTFSYVLILLKMTYYKKACNK